VGFAVDEVVLWQVLSGYFGFLANSHSTDCFTLFIITIIRGWYNMSITGRSAKWAVSPQETKKPECEVMESTTIYMTQYGTAQKPLANP
jgi:hypothetical protein